MDLNNTSDTDFNRKKKPLAGTNKIGLGANQHPETWIPQQPVNLSLSGTIKQPLNTAPFNPASPTPLTPLVKATNASPTYTNTATTTPIASNNPVAMNAPKFDLAANAADKLVKVEPYNLAQNVPNLSPTPKLSPAPHTAPPTPPVQAFGDKMASGGYVPPTAPSIGQKLVGVGKGLVRNGIQGAALEGATQANNYLLDRDLKNGAFTDNASRVQNFGTGARLVGTAVLDNPILKRAGNQVADTINANVIKPVLSGTQAAYDYAFTSPNELKARNQSAPAQATQPLRNVQVPDLNTPQVAQSLHQMANRPSLVGTKTSVDQMMNTNTLPPATMGTQAAMSPVNLPNRITAALNDPNNYHEHLMQNAKNAGIDKFQPNLNYADDLNALGGARKLVGTQPPTQDSQQQAPVTQRLVGTVNGKPVFKDSNGVTSMNGKVINDGKQDAENRKILPNWAIDKLRSQALYEHNPQALQALLSLQHGNQTGDLENRKLGFEQDKFGKTSQLAQQEQEFTQGIQNRQVGLQESNAQWEREKPTQQFENERANLQRQALVGSEEARQKLAAFDPAKLEKISTSTTDAAGNKYATERLVNPNHETTLDDIKAFAAAQRVQEPVIDEPKKKKGLLAGLFSSNEPSTSQDAPPTFKKGDPIEGAVNAKGRQFREGENVITPDGKKARIVRGEPVLI